MTLSCRFLEHLPESSGVFHLNSQPTWPGGAGLVTTESSSDGQGPEAHHSRQGAPMGLAVCWDESLELDLENGDVDLCVQQGGDE